MLPDALQTALIPIIGTIISSAPCAGGDINQAYRIETAQERFFAKYHARPPQGMFQAEAQGLQLLRTANALRVPEVMAAGENFLLLEWLERGNPSDQSETRLGEGLAVLHQHTASTYGLDHPNFIGSLPQINTPKTTWGEFYRECRIRPQMDIARLNGELSAGLEKLLERVIANLPNLLPETRPSLLHGDLWRGNVMILADGQPALIDPAVYYGNPEVELAFTELFGGFGTQFYSAYGTLDAGYGERKALYQLYPLLVHMNLFGGGYTAQVHALARHYA